MTTTAPLDEKTIVGKALYLELVPTVGDLNRVTQILLTPEAYDHKGNFVRMALHSRTVSESSPRKQWRINFSNVSNKELVDNAVSMAMPILKTTAQELAVSMTSRFESSLVKQITYQFVVRKRPVVVEVSALDLSEIGSYATPQALMRRLQKARVACGLPEKLV
jgi:hypothetical protein